MKKAKYFSISVDSTPDVSHCDQLVFCVKYVQNGESIERFIKFIQIDQHKSEYLANTVIEFMSKNSINFSDCRGQSYDNTNNMAGKYSGLQKRLLDLNKFAIFRPCASHSLNLVGTAAVSKNKFAVSFFCFMESIYSFFVNSPSRWKLLNDALEQGQLVLKRATGTRWSARFNSVDALNGNIKQVQSVLLRLINDNSLQTTPENKVLATGHLAELCKFENILMLKIWYSILVKFERANITLQKSDLNLSVAVQIYQSLVDHCEGLKDRFYDFFQDAKSTYIELNAEEYTFKSRSAITLDNMDQKKNELCNEMFMPVIESLITNLEARMNCYVQVEQKFGFLSKLNGMDFDQISVACHKIASIYQKMLMKKN